MLLHYKNLSLTSKLLFSTILIFIPIIVISALTLPDTYDDLDRSQQRLRATSYLGDLYEFVQRPSVTTRAELTRSLHEMVALNGLEAEIPNNYEFLPPLEQIGFILKQVEAVDDQTKLTLVQNSDDDLAAQAIVEDS
ncbi:MAG: hypothetical protein ORO03_01040, partial [Alphaproteobacteria bacterium]|nr:hypothetical protein [Alphaproteobacteria bacterium]